MKKTPLILLTLAFVLMIHSSSIFADDGPGTCTRCGKDISAEARKFSVVQKETAKPVAFDDIGHALLWREDQCMAIQTTFDATAKVYDFYSGDEVDINSAYFVRDKGTVSPGGSGIVAFKDTESAKKFIEQNGGEKILSYDELLMISLE